MIFRDLADAFRQMLLAALAWSAVAGALVALAVVLITAAITGARRSTEDA